MKLDSKLLAVLLALAAFASFAWVVFNSTIIFGDEAYYAADGRWIAQNAVWPSYEPMMQTAIYMAPFQKQPLFIFLNSAVQLIAGELGIKLMLPLIAALAGLAIFLFAKDRFGSVAALAAMAVFFMANGVVTYAVLDYVEMFNVLLFVLALHFALKDKPENMDLLMAGLFTGLSMLTDVTGLFLGPLLIIALLWKSRLSGIKPLLTIGVIALLVMSPFLMRNLYFFGGFCMPGPGILGTCSIAGVPDLGVTMTLPSADSGGTSSQAITMGFANYFNFATGFPVLIFLLFGIAALIYRRDAWYVLVPWFGLFVLLTFQQSLYGGRAEDIPRYTLFGFPALALVAGIFFADAYDFLKKYNRILAGLLVCLVLLFAVPGMLQKMDGMKSAKTFPAGFYDACNWVQANTDADARLFTPYQHAMSWLCDRRGYAGGEVPDVPLILSANNDTAYQRLKAHGTNYIFIPEFVVSDVAYGGTISTGMISYMDSSSHFKLVFDDRNVYGNAGVRIYQIL
jgi:4-amino-4-deoxy-L-arabinose transferase-like glycosyltransferase